MRKNLLLILGLLYSSVSVAQINLEQKLTQKVIGCDDIAFNSSDLFIQYLQIQEYDSARMVLSFWETNCTLNEPLMRAKIMLMILSETMNESIYDSTILNYVSDFEERIFYSNDPSFKAKYDYFSPYFGYVPLNSNFDKRIKEIALNFKAFDNALEELFCLLYTEKIDEFYFLLQTSRCEGTIIKKCYDHKINELKKIPDLFYNIGFGAYIPVNQNHLIGNHPTLNIGMGFFNQNYEVEWIIDMRFGKTESPYQMVVDDTISSRNFFGVYLGLAGGYKLIKYKRHDLLLTAGFGIDMFDTEYDYDSDKDDYVSVNRPNLNFGLKYKFHINELSYIELAYRYNIVHYYHKQILNDLSGQFHVFSLKYAFLENGNKYNELHNLRYFNQY